MIATSILRAAELARILDQTAPHRSKPDTWQDGSVTLLDADPVRLHAVTTSRYTVAVGSAALSGPDSAKGEPWSTTLQDDDADSLAAWARTRGYDEDVRLIVAPDRLEASTLTSSLRVPVSATKFPLRGGWRPFIAARVEPSTGTAPKPVALDTATLRRWKGIGDYVWLGVSEHDGSLLVLGEDFVGVQAPVAKGWQAPLAHASAAADGRPVEVLPLPDGDDEFSTIRWEMLRRMVVADEAIKDARYAGDGALADAFLAVAGSSHVAVRALRALERIDARRAHEVAAAISDELDSGEFIEAAFETAVALSLDPSAWIAQYNASRTAPQES
ncbi:hypothetical protein [Kitasatospora sp. NBC_01300]|uniref:hypothetical protein n=1 Tax=Kitasatospora sp. NBC_01300 TaxID=2903574 RepID=UPI00352CDAD3|nr:hypothetical protein OG556_40195 [Kitasatospora sp. NBC_01300]